MNTWCGVGNLTRDPEARVTQDGIDVCRFTIAINRRRNADGEIKADFVPIVAYRKTAAVCREYLRKGRKVSVVAELQTYSYEKADGQKVYGFQMVASDVRFLSPSDPNKSNFGDIHSDMMGATHHDLNNMNILPDTSGFTQMDDDIPDLPF